MVKVLDDLGSIPGPVSEFFVKFILLNSVINSLHMKQVVHKGRILSDQEF